jgi:hypothetical protein
MDKLLEFYNRNVNVLDLGNGLMLGRESVKGIDYMTISKGDEVLYSWWHNPNKTVTNKPPKHTGGKPSYVKLLIKEMQKHPELSVEAAGVIQKLIPNVKWGDNLLIHTRSKKPLRISDICEITHKSKPFIIKTFNELKAADLLVKDNEGYKISSSLIQKGGGKK